MKDKPAFSILWMVDKIRILNPYTKPTQMKYLWLIILSLFVSSSYSQDTTTVDKMSGDTVIVLKDKANKLIYTNDTRKLIKVKPKFREDTEKTRVGIIVRNTFYGAVAGGLITMALVNLGHNDDNDIYFHEKMVAIGIGTGVGIPIGFIVGGVKAAKHKRKLAGNN
jgi:hypothetical protein